MKNITPVILIIFSLFPITCLAQKTDTHYLISVNVTDQNSENLLLSLNPDFAKEKFGSNAEIIVDDKGLLELQNHGFQTQIIRELSPGPIDPEYHRYEEVLSLLDNYHNTYPDITYLDTIGVSQRLGFYIPAIKISDNPGIEEDEPAVLFDGLHHAREPVSMECNLVILDYLLSNYGTDPQVTEWIDNTEIWIVPMINPEGWYYLVENELGNPWWRKNLRENGNNATINTDFDGVDVNRNYDFNWILGGSGDPGSWTYRGPEVFSESEARAKRDLALEQKFLISLSYHSHGQIVIYSWRESPRAPDQELLVEIASGIASRIPKFDSEGSYDPRASDCQNGFSRCWMYGGAGTFEFTVETAPSFMPPGENGLKIAQDNLPGALYVLDRINGPGLSGHITDKLSGEPLAANYRILEIYNDILVERKSDSLYGRYDRLLLPDTYSLIVSKEGYLSDTIPNIVVADGEMTRLDIQLIPVISGIEDLKPWPSNAEIGISQNYPNPFTSFTTIKYYTSQDASIKIEVFDLMGKKTATLTDKYHPAGDHQLEWDGGDSNGNKLPGGFYYYRISNGKQIHTRKILIK